MNKKIIAILALPLLLSACGLTDDSSSTTSVDSSSDSSSETTSEVTTSEESTSEESSSESSTSTGPVEKTISAKTGEIITLDSDDYVIEGDDAEGVIVHLDGNKLYTIVPGSVKLSNGSTNYTVNIEYAFAGGLSYGSDYLAFCNSSLQNVFRGTSTDPYTVGNENEFILDIGLAYFTCAYDIESGEWYQDATDTIHINELDADYLNNLSISLEGKTLSTYAVITDNNTLIFNESAIGEDLTVKVTLDEDSLSQNIHVVEGYNVYESADLKHYFEDSSITSSINVLRSFEATVDESQIFFNEGEGPYLYNTIDDEAARTHQGSVYYRYVDATEPQEITINGNYMVLDASNVPHHFPGEPELIVDESIRATESSLINGLVCNPQEAIFRSYSVNTAGIETISFKNYNIRGNANKSGEDETSSLDSTGLQGIITNRNILNVENCVLDYVVYGGQFNYNGSETLVKDTIVQNTWGSSLVTWKSNKLDVQNCLLTKAGSAAIWLINNSIENDRIVANIDSDTVIDNYLTTNSGWFTAYGLTALSTFTQAIEGNINTYTAQVLTGLGLQGYAHTMFKDDSAKFNFVTLVQDTSESETYPYADLTIKGLNSVVDPHSYSGSDYASTYPMVYGVYSANGQIIKSLGQSDAELNTIITQLVPTLMEKGLDQATAVNYAYLYALSVGLSDDEVPYIEVDANIQNTFNIGAIIEVSHIK